MYERMMCKEPPSPEETEKLLGGGAATLKQIEEFLYQNYDIIRELKYPFGKVTDGAINTATGARTFVIFFSRTER
jgi:Tfp pilus assembly PilM family ATPase